MDAIQVLLQRLCETPDAWLALDSVAAVHSCLPDASDVVHRDTRVFRVRNFMELLHFTGLSLNLERQGRLRAPECASMH